MPNGLSKWTVEAWLLSDELAKLIERNRIEELAMAELAERFWRQVEVRGPDECWPWKGAKSRGYGILSRARGKSPYKAHRIAYQLQHDVIPEGQHVLHRCDNPPCCNGAHLFIGTAKDNLRDASQKGRLNPTSLKNLRPGAPGVRGASRG